MAFNEFSHGREYASERLLDRDEPRFPEFEFPPGESHFERARGLLKRHLGVHIPDHVREEDGWSHLLTGLHTAAAHRAGRGRGGYQGEPDRPMLPGIARQIAQSQMKLSGLQ